MNKKIIIMVFLFILIWNIISFSLFSDVIEYEDNSKEILNKSIKNSENPNITEQIAIYNHSTDNTEFMDLEEYILHVLAAEMPVSYGLEALKAQAVAARTYTLYCIKNGKEKEHNADVCTDYKHCQAYKSDVEILEAFNDMQRSLINQAVEETKGKILTYDNEVINALYHASSDTKTESAKNVWGNDVPYLVSVASPGENSMSGFYSEISLSNDGFFEKLQYLSNDISRVSPDVSYNSSGRVDVIFMHKKDGEKISIPGTKIREIFSLRSASFDIEFIDNKVVFKVRGYGHGVGMSQYGAKLMAENGKTYEDILLHYYTNCKIADLNTDIKFD